MRLTSIALAFLFLINVLATPINPLRGNVVALRRRSPNEHDTPGKVATPKTRTTTSLQKGGNGSTMETKCKRATPNELIKALSTADTERQFPTDKDCIVYPLTTKVDNENVILKVIHNGMGEEEEIKDEAWALENVKQLLGWAHTPDKKLYYLFMKNMGVPLSQTTFANDYRQVRKLQRKAEEFYLSHYHLRHDDHGKDTKNWVYRKAGGEWRAELIDWECFTREDGYEGYKNPPEPFEIDPNCGYFVPEKYLRYIRQ
ncbi:hypothetical protein F5887DRAFT_1018348 [Amanita rubescens]|nr:hypothetical protein F5887DRAFT_1018348 [Amanita rubescens]